MGHFYSRGTGNAKPRTRNQGGEPRDWQAPEEMQMADKHVKRRSISREPEKGKNSTGGYFSPIRLANVLDKDNIALRGKHRLPSF